MLKVDMAVLVSMLRGVNLAAHNRIAMAKLRDVYESIALRDPQTYVQSGNVVFRTEERDLPLLAARIEKAIETEFGFRCDVIVRTVPEMRRAIAENPFAARRDLDPARLLVTFLATEPADAAKKKLLAIKTDPEELHLRGREAYIYFPNGMGRSKLSWTAVAKALGTTGTGRNWNTVQKLLEMAEKMASA